MPKITVYPPKSGAQSLVCIGNLCRNNPRTWTEKDTEIAFMAAGVMRHMTPCALCANMFGKLPLEWFMTVSPATALPFYRDPLPIKFLKTIIVSAYPLAAQYLSVADGDIVGRLPHCNLQTVFTQQIGMIGCLSSGLQLPLTREGKLVWATLTATRNNHP